MGDNYSSWKDKVLFTPGPLTTSQTVKLALLHDHGTWDREFNDLVRDIRARLIRVAGASEQQFTAIPLQGSGTYGLEAVLATTVPQDGRVLVLINGAYGHRIAKMSRILGIDTLTLEFDEDVPVDRDAVNEVLSREEGITHVVLVHCETTSGILNDLSSIGGLVHDYGASFFVDAMSSFGAYPIDFEACHIDYLVSSANKCIEGVPGFTFVFARLEKLLACEGFARSLSLDLLDQYRSFESSEKFRFTPATQVMAAFRQALIELEDEGGVAGRGARYSNNHKVLIDGMRTLGFCEHVAPENQSYIITSFRYPEIEHFEFTAFYQYLHDRGYIIYPGKLSKGDCFRIGTIGRITENDMKDLLSAIREYMTGDALGAS